MKNLFSNIPVSETMWLIESSANFFAGAYAHQRYYWDGYMYTTVTPHLALWQHYLYMVAKIKLLNHQIGKPESHPSQSPNCGIKPVSNRYCPSYTRYKGSFPKA